jgi:hypothetical protein
VRVRGIVCVCVCVMESGREADPSLMMVGACLSVWGRVGGSRAREGVSVCLCPCVRDIQCEKERRDFIHSFDFLFF